MSCVTSGDLLGKGYEGLLSADEGGVSLELNEEDIPCLLDRSSLPLPTALGPIPLNRNIGQYVS